jgi:DNA (cytosine-5)-methyltransferase 3A
VAYEIDKYAVQTSSHNFPIIEHRGDVFQADFTQYEGVDFLVGGSPCTHWSIARSCGRETEASGVGWELFCQYVRALEEAKPKFFIYENNKSMHANIRENIDRAFGFEAICINSALVSAQNRQRLYWVGMRNEDGSYSKVPVDQPKDREILLRDVLDCVAINTTADGDKARTLMAGYYKYGTATLIANKGFTGGTTAVAEPVNVGDCQTIEKAIPKLVDKYGYVPEKFNAYNIAEITDKTPTLSTGSMATSSCATTMFEKSDKPVYEVRNGLITIKGKQYPIKLADGFYIIRKLTVSECKRLQTVPEWYEFPVSDSQAYKMLGNGWTVEVIAHLINATQTAEVFANERD